MALDEAGSLYVALEGAGQVAVFSPEGRRLETYPLPGPRDRRSFRRTGTGHALRHRGRGRDYRLVTRQIERFAGPELLSPFTTIHWGAATLAAARALREEGVRGLVGYFEERDELPRVAYYLFTPQWRYLLARDYWKDTRQDLIFLRHDLVINTVALEGIVPHLERVAADPHQAEVLELMIHEQYFYPDYVAYQPDFRRRVERAIRWAVERGYRPAFFEEGFLGAAPH